MANEKQHIELIRKDSQASQRIKDSLNNSIKSLAKDLYSKDTHFIFELIQNAEDNYYNNREAYISFQLKKKDPTNTPNSDGALIIENNEVGFSKNNVDAICAIGKTTKSKTQGYIGEKGIGFKAVFRVTSNPYIFSNNYSFSLPEYDSNTGLGYIVPLWVESSADLDFVNPHNTTIILPLDKSEYKFEKIEEMLNDIKPETLLFLNKLQEIHIETDSDEYLTMLKDNSKFPHVYVFTEGKKKGKYFEIAKEFLLSAKTFEKPDNIKQEKREEIYEREVTVAFPLKDDEEGKGKIYAYLPVRADTRLPFIINADFILTSSREEIQDVPWNHWLMDCVAQVVADGLYLLKNNQFLTVEFLDSLTNRLNEIASNPKDFYYPIFLKVRDILNTEEILPANDSTFVKGQNAKLARGSELRNLLSNKQLSFLFKTTTNIKWLSKNITEDMNRNLRYFLLNHLKIDELRPDKFIELLSNSFLEKQSDQWLISFYSFLLKTRSDTSKKNKDYLHSLKFIRLENDDHVYPFNENGNPNAYLPTRDTNLPTVKSNIFDADEAVEFLKKIGLVEPDQFSDLIEFVLPKYDNEQKQINLKENIHDLEKIWICFNEEFKGDISTLRSKLKILWRKKNLQTDYIDTISKEKLEGGLLRGFVIIILQSSQILRAVNATSKEVSYKAPKDVYANMPILHKYFEKNSNIWFISHEYGESYKILFEMLGIKSSPKIFKKNSDSNGYVIIQNHYGLHKRGLNGFDPDIKVEGLDFAISSLTFEKSEFIWNNIAIPNASCIQGEIEEATNKNYNKSTKSSVFSNFGRLLMSSNWLPGNNTWCKPSELSLEDLPDSFTRDEKLADLLGMKKPEIEQALDLVIEGDHDLKQLIIAYKEGSEAKRRNLLKQIKQETQEKPAPSFCEGLANLARSQRGNLATFQQRGPSQETYPVNNPERYQDKCNEAVANAIEEHSREYKVVSFTPVRNRPDNKEAREFLYNEYQGRCQITGNTFPKSSSNAGGISKNYFEACSLLSYSNADYLNDAGNMLCVSADTLAKLKYASFEWLDDIQDKIYEFENEGNKYQYISIRIKLAEEEGTITWSQRHFMRLVSLYHQA
ncbi:MAG: sacsin N-terminal ATP-binding-like domain-containing protein [bacterium]